MSAFWRGLVHKFNLLPSAYSVRTYFLQMGGETQATSLLTDSSCSRSDYLMVPQAKLDESDARATYFCGAISKDVVISSKCCQELRKLFPTNAVSLAHARQQPWSLADAIQQRRDPQVASGGNTRLCLHLRGRLKHERNVCGNVLIKGITAKLFSVGKLI